MSENTGPGLADLGICLLSPKAGGPGEMVYAEQSPFYNGNAAITVVETDLQLVISEVNILHREIVEAGRERS